ncbi:DUF3846 domain-containing protein [Shouchella lonarensis]|uniref:DUF3846 domain-containing protein n=1 Tax=Shouchella lonarensis TaxID=1464122 RepID=A0A1G6HMG3_9BACI|nr:DUF3846 domain-containing protein [Shouchella lonarensis]SDB95432.1 protein of unknown function [Shouchella lonarensis]
MGKKVLLLTPGEHKTEFEIKPYEGLTLQAQQNFVGGMLAAMPITPNTDLWYNDEFLLLDMPPTIVVSYGNSEPTTICGPVFFSSHNGKGVSKGLNQDQMNHIIKMINSNIVQLSEQVPPFKTRIIPWLQLGQ